MPPPAPVMIVTLSASRIGASSLSCVRRAPHRTRLRPAPASPAIRACARRPRRARGVPSRHAHAQDLDRRRRRGGRGARGGHRWRTTRRSRAARGDDGVSALLHARYRFDRATTGCCCSPPTRRWTCSRRGARAHRSPSGAARGRSRRGVTAFAADGFTALHFAAFFGKAEAARLLLEAGASTARLQHNDFANQPLHAAAAGRHIEVCRVLLAAGADVNATQHGGYAPLHEVARERATWSSSSCSCRPVPTWRLAPRTAGPRSRSQRGPVMSTSRAGFARWTPRTDGPAAAVTPRVALASRQEQPLAGIGEQPDRSPPTRPARPARRRSERPPRAPGRCRRGPSPRRWRCST